MCSQNLDMSLYLQPVPTYLYIQVPQAVSSIGVMKQALKHYRQAEKHYQYTDLLDKSSWRIYMYVSRPTPFYEIKIGVCVFVHSLIEN